MATQAELDDSQLKRLTGHQTDRQTGGTVISIAQRDSVYYVALAKTTKCTYVYIS